MSFSVTAGLDRFSKARRRAQAIRGTGTTRAHTRPQAARSGANDERRRLADERRRLADEKLRTDKAERERRASEDRVARAAEKRAAQERKDAQREDRGRERAEAKRRRLLLQEQTHRKREDKIAAQEREDMIDSRRPPVPRKRRKPTFVQTDYEIFTNPASLFCADCDKEFTPGDIRHKMRDGRTICAKCQKAAKTKAAKKAQPALFGEMEGSQNVLFNPSCEANAYEVKEYTVKEHCRARRGTGTTPKAAKAKSVAKPRAKATRAKRTTKKREEDLTLSQFVRRLGGIKPTRDGSDRGELAALTNKEGMTSGLINKSSDYSLEYMMDAANEAGYRDPYDNSEFELGSFASAVSDDAQGYVKISHPGKEYDFSYRANPAAVAFMYEVEAYAPARRAWVSLGSFNARSGDGAIRQGKRLAAKGGETFTRFKAIRRNPSNDTLTVTPQLARELLKTMRNNRALESARVNKMVARMKAGNYQDKNGLIFDGGILRDGQHRLNAVIKSGETVTFNVRRANPALQVLGQLSQLSMLPGGILGMMELHKRLNKKQGKKKKRAKNPGAPANIAQIHKEFLDREPSKVKEYFTPPGAPADLARLGRLVEVGLVGRAPLKFHTNPSAMLCASGGDTKRHMHIALSARYELPDGASAGREYVLGEVKYVDYAEIKAHLKGSEDGKRHIFRHKMGEEGGKKPYLIFVDGYLKFRGGDYQILREGLRN